MKSGGPPLSALVTAAVDFFFEGERGVTVAAVLLDHCGSGLPLASSADVIERIRLAVLKLADGNAEAVLDHVGEAMRDWRDVLVAAGFGDDLTAHTSWASGLSSWSFNVTEVSACVYKVVASNRDGRSASFKGTDPDALLTQARKAAVELHRADK